MEAQQNNATKRLPSPPLNSAPNPKALHHLLFPNPEVVSPPCPPHEPEASQKPPRKRKRSQEIETSQEPLGKWPRAATNDHRSSHPLEAWLQEDTWPKEYFESGIQTWDDIKAETVKKLGANAMNPILARKKSATSLASLRRQALAADTITASETIEDKSLPYRSQGYERELEIRGRSYLIESPVGITDESKVVCQTLLTTVQAVPQDTLFRDDLFEETCNKIRNRNEARVVEDISPLIVPSAETLATYGATELKYLVFNVNERWGESIPITETRPQPDRCAGFDHTAFTWSQLQKLKPFIGNYVPVDYCSYFLATWRMMFPFLTCEAKSGTGDLDVADKQNGHSMTMAMRAIFQLFKIVNREKELHRKILTFSVSHDASMVRIYGHYPLIEEHVATFYRHPIHEFSFTTQSGRDRWMAHHFTKNVYFEFMPKLHKLICSAIDQLSLDQVSQGSNLPPQIPPGDSLGGTDPESEQPNPQEMAASTPTSQHKEGFKKPRLTPNAMLQQQVEELKRQLFERDGNTSEVVKILKQENERERQETERERQETQRERQEKERQRQESNEQLEQHKQEISKLTASILSLAAQSQKGSIGK